MEDYRQTDEYCQYFYKKNWFVEKIGRTRVLIKKIPLLGSIIKMQKCDADISLSDIDELAIIYHALFVVIEPNINTEDKDYEILEKSLLNRGYHNFNYFLSPTKTSYIDISGEEEQIIHSFDADIRKSLNQNYMRKVEYTEVEGLENFYPILSSFSGNRHLFIQNSKDWKNKWAPFGKQIHLIFAHLNGQILGANMFLIRPPYVFGIFLPTSIIGRKYKISANLILEAIKSGKKAGCTFFDLNGMYDERFNAPKDWIGLTNFKKKFRGHLIEFMHPKVKVYSKLVKPFASLGILWMFLVDSN